MAALPAGFAVVKSVLSGDTVVIVGQARAGVTSELQLSLSCIAAPRAARHPDSKDEPGGFAAREFLRKIVIGRLVKFRCDYKAGPSGRAFATLWLPRPEAGAPEGSPLTVAEGAPSINFALARAGVCRAVPPPREEGGAARLTPDEAEAILAAGREAEKAGFGVWGEAAVRSLQWGLGPEQLAALGEAGTLVPAVIEQVLGGATLRCYLSTRQAMVTVSLAGVQCPRAGAPLSATSAAVGASAAASGGAVDPIGAEARAFTEQRLLQRDVELSIGGLDKFGNLVASVTHPLGDIAVELLRNGLGKVAEWSCTFATAAHVTALRTAERVAKAARLRLWAAYEAPARSTISGPRSFDGKVVEVLSGDTLVVLTNPRRAAGVAPEERRISLSSLRAPRVGNARRGEIDAPFAFESKEHLRRSLIGREVHVDVEYSRAPGAGGAGAGPRDDANVAPAKEPAGPAGPDRVFATVTYANRKGETVDVAFGVVSEGLAECALHRGDEERSCHYDELLALEETARSQRRGLFSLLKEAHGGGANAKAAAGPSTPSYTPRRIADLSLEAGKARAHFPFLQRSKVIKAIPEFIFAGGRVKLFIPADNVYLVFGVAGVRCPAVAKKEGAAGGFKGPDGKVRPSRPGEPCGPEALAYMRETVLQQEVEIEAEDMDRNGVVLGPMWTGKGAARRNVGAELLRGGLASTVGPVLERGTREGEELLAAEAEARAAKRGLWAFVAEPTVAEEGEEGEEDEGGPTNAAAGSGELRPRLGAGGAGAGASASAPRAVELVGILSGQHFAYVLESERSNVDAVRGHMSQLLAEHGKRHAGLPSEPRKGMLVAALCNGERWLRAKIEGRHKAVPGEPAPSASEAGLVRWDVLHADVGSRDVITVLQMRPLLPPFSSIPPLAHEAALALLRVPALSADLGPEAAETLSEKAWGRPLMGRELVELVDAETGASMGVLLAELGLARVSRTEAKRVRRRGDAGAEAVYLRALEKAQAGARAGHRGLFIYGDRGDSDTEDAPKRGGAWGK